jgi:hypothetical protein
VTFCPVTFCPIKIVTFIDKILMQPVLLRTGTAVDLHLKSLQILVVWSAVAKMMD